MKAQHLLNVRLATLDIPAQADADLRFLVRLHVSYEVLAKLGRQPGIPRDLGCGAWTPELLLALCQAWEDEETGGGGLSGIWPEYEMTGLFGVHLQFYLLHARIAKLLDQRVALTAAGVDVAVLAPAVRNLQSQTEFMRPGRVFIPPEYAGRATRVRTVTALFFDLARLAAQVHILLVLADASLHGETVQRKVKEMVALLKKVDTDSSFNTAHLWAFFLGGCAAKEPEDRTLFHDRFDTLVNAPSGNIWALRDVMQECWTRNDDIDSQPVAEGQTRQYCHWTEVAKERGWSLCIM